MIVRTITVTPFEQNARVVASGTDAFIIDPGGDVLSILNAVPRLNSDRDGAVLPVRGIILTHAHIDHAGGVRRTFAELAKTQQLKPQLFAHPAEQAMRKSVGQQALMFGLSPKEYESVPEPDVLIDDGAEIAWDNGAFQVLFTPGHSPGHVSLFHPNVEALVQEMSRDGGSVRQEQKYSGPLLLAGDALFAGSIGRTDLPGGSHAQLVKSIREKLLALPDETLVLSGHGGNTTIGRERKTNPFLQ